MNETPSIGTNELDTTDLTLIERLASGSTMTEAAAGLGLSASSAYRRARRPAFKAALVEHRGSQWRPIAHALRCECLASVRVMARIRDDDTVSARVRSETAAKIIEMAVGLSNHLDVVPAIAELQREVEADRGGGLAFAGDAP